MNRPSFLEGALVALLAALSAPLLYALGAWTGVSGLVAGGLGAGYLLYLLGRSPGAAGRVTLGLAWLPTTAAVWILTADPIALGATQLLLLWLVRALRFQRAPLAALLDLALVGAGAAAAWWAGMRTGSLMAAVWTLFLIQALFVAIPLRPGASRAPDPAAAFARARRTAESALTDLERMSRHSTLGDRHER